MVTKTKGKCFEEPTVVTDELTEGQTVGQTKKCIASLRATKIDLQCILYVTTKKITPNLEFWFDVFVKKNNYCKVDLI